MNCRKSLLLIATFLFGWGIIAQNSHVKGAVFLSNNEPAAGVVVQLLGTTKVVLTDGYGNFEIPNLKYGDYRFKFSTVEANELQKTFNIQSPVTELSVILERKTSELNEIQIQKKSIRKELTEKGYAVNVIETKELGLRNVQVNELLDRSVGVRIRQNGGLGSEVNYNINGMSGNTVRIFVDGVPISTFGSSFDLNSIPATMIERIEVYKGVIPGYLADDALGGAINIVLNKKMRNNVSVSASYGSFNTSQVNFNGTYRMDSGFTLKASGFLNNSDNDYKVWGKNVYNILPNGRYEYVKARRFNDAFKSLGGVVELGFSDVSWADNFFIGFTTSDSYKEIQHGTFMTTPYKGRFSESNANLVNLTYNKKNLFTSGLDINLHAVYGERERMVSDTVKWNYNWSGIRSVDLNGNPILRPQGAQQGQPTIANINREVATVRSGISYAIDNNHRFLFNHLMNIVNREDDDEIRSVLERKFFGTRDLTKNIFSYSYELTAFQEKLKSTLFGKHYQQKVERMNPVVQTTNGVSVVVEDVVSSNKTTNGYGMALSYTLLPNLSIMGSFERAVRLPNESEIFGDPGDNVSENPYLKAETSKNINAGFSWTVLKADSHQINWSMNGFVRDINDRIGTPVTTVINSNVQTLPFVNQGNVKSRGFDAEINYKFQRDLLVNFNLSKFDLTTEDVYGRTKDIPNEPTFMMNANAQYTFNNIFLKDSKFTLHYNYLFVDTFNYMSVPYGNNAGTDFFQVPQQHIHDAGMSYAFPNRKLIVSFDVKNFTNKQAFDNFAVQKPGIAFYLKLNYVINNF